MPESNEEVVEELARRFGRVIPGLEAELLAALKQDIAAAPGDAPRELVSAIDALGGARLIAELPGSRAARAAGVAAERIVMAARGARPVARVIDNQATTDFLGPAQPSWHERIRRAKSNLDAAIPAVGRVELNNSDDAWCGTAWLVADDILVTNRHVAETFARMDRRTSRFVFRAGLSGAPVSSDIDFLEEERRRDSDEHPITSILWIAGSNEADVAFLRVTPRAGRKLPRPIRLAASVTEDAVVAAIGYPARDPSIPDQQLVIRIFGDGVYDKKRLAPGQITRVEPDVLHHDCSTLGGNSGSVLVDLDTGNAVGLHYGGYLDDSTNVAVPAPYLRELLDRVLQRGTEASVGHTTTSSALSSTATTIPAAIAPTTVPGSYRLSLSIPVEIEVRVGALQPSGSAAPSAHVGHVQTSTAEDGTESELDAAVRLARERLANDPNVLDVRAGYRFKNGWITDEPAVVVSVRTKLPYAEVRSSGLTRLPREINGIGVDVRAAPLAMQLRALGVDTTVLERPGKPAGYVEPPGHRDPASEMYLGRVREQMDAIFHVSPDAGFRELKSFLSRVRGHLTATMYEWEPTHVSDEIERAVNERGATLRMVTQRRGVFNSDATESAVADMQERIGEFEHVWASVTGKNRLIPGAYHIKVASRDDEEVWLSSGNWKDSNQPVDPEIPAALRTHNRDWHVVIKNARLATLFKRYVEYDFEEARRVGEEADEAPFGQDVELFVPNEVVDEAARRLPPPGYEPALVITNERLDIQPLLTPDRDGSGERIFMRAATELVRRARKTLYIQNQSLSFTNDNNREFDGFFDAVRTKQQEIDDVRIIARDAREFGGGEGQQKFIEELQGFGLDVSPRSLRLQRRCHTKGIIVDGREVLMGSHNLTNVGSLFNRDASLLVRSEKVARFYEKIFLYDWENLAHNQADERGGIRRARPGEETPEGFSRVKLSDLLDV